ncbi:MAG: hypothetical protein O7C60_06090, partial [Rickettsia endosymbiont of Ixodes persulcatus]|nr:hypothetical protein [Rickettsia endosymbiont of Ixodes persulcatus]
MLTSIIKLLNFIIIYDIGEYSTSKSYSTRLISKKTQIKVYIMKLSYINGFGNKGNTFVARGIL